MAQYTEILGETPLDIEGNHNDFRYFVDTAGTHNMYLRQTITPTGFEGAEGVDWDDIEEYINPSTISEWRVGVRDAHWVIDVKLTGTGYAGIEDTDWTNIETHSLP